MLILLAIIGIAPFVYLAILSTKKRIDILEVPPSLSFDWETIKENYDVVINDDSFLTLIKNSIIVTGVSTLIALLIGVPAAYAFSRLRFRGREQWSTTILSFRFMPPVAVAIPIFLMMREIGLEDSYPGLILPYVAFSLPLTVWIMIGFFDEIPRELDDAALVDGCAAARRPRARPAAAGAARHGRRRDLRRDLHLERVPRRALRHHVARPQTVPIGASALLTTQSPIDWNIAAGVGVLTTIPILIFSIFVQRYIVRGMTAGAIR